MKEQLYTKQELDDALRAQRKKIMDTLRSLELNYGCEGGISPEEMFQYLDKELKGVKGYWSPKS